jgi:cytochrome P450
LCDQTITFAIHDLCLHPEYTEPLRAELEAEYSEFLKTGQGLPLLDSFIKESARLTPVESSTCPASPPTPPLTPARKLLTIPPLVSTRRQALAPFQFSDGTKLAAGDWACTPVRAIMQNEALYPAPLEFHGFRFVDKTNVSIKAANIEDHFRISQEKPSTLCSADATWHVWGSGRMIW